MNTDTVYWVVTESNISASDIINMANTTFLDKNKAYSKLYKLLAYYADPDPSETRKLLSAYMTEHHSDAIFIVEYRVFDRRDNS